MFFFTAFAGGLSRVDSVPGFDYPAGYTTFVYGFVLLQASTFGGIFTGFAIARDFESGFSRRLMLGASHRGGIVGGLLDRRARARGRTIMRDHDRGPRWSASSSTARRSTSWASTRSRS